MTNDVVLRRAGLDDAESMQTCAARAYADVLGRLEGMPDVTGGMAEDLRNHSAILAESGGAVVGFVILANADDAMKVANLACDPAFAGRGIARRLLDEVARVAREKGKQRLELTTHEGMRAAQAFYRHLGWRESGRSKQAVFFVKPL